MYKFSRAASYLQFSIYSSKCVVAFPRHAATFPRTPIRHATVPGQHSQGPPFPGVTIPRVRVRVRVTECLTLGMAHPGNAEP